MFTIYSDVITFILFDIAVNLLIHSIKLIHYIIPLLKNVQRLELFLNKNINYRRKQKLTNIKKSVRTWNQPAKIIDIRQISYFYNTHSIFIYWNVTVALPLKQYVLFIQNIIYDSLSWKSNSILYTVNILLILQIILFLRVLLCRELMKKNINLPSFL